ncbi:hypothetical protein [Poriferisphaera sp. WC338]|uniref:hypothetical protein n=1 Tax=Poriferisphaera sp. WC338 TaxID=3425129 RepID=UPI003D81617E
MEMRRNHWVMLLLVVGCAVLSACNTQPIIPEQDKLLPPRISAPTEWPDYETLVARYNANVEKISNLRAGVDFQIKYVDDEGNKKTEDGGGKFFFISPDNMTLVLSKAGIEIFWAGTNAEKYWLFDLHNDHLFWGYNRYAGLPKTFELQNIPIQPDEVTHLLGLRKIPVLTDDAPEPAIQKVNGYAVITLPRQYVKVPVETGPVVGEIAVLKGGWRYYLDPETGLPAGIDFLDAELRTPVITSRISNPKTFSSSRVAPVMRPKLPGQAEMYFHETEAYLRLYLLDYSDRKPPSVLFDFDKQLQKKKPKETFQLDIEYTRDQ